MRPTRHELRAKTKNAKSSCRKCRCKKSTSQSGRRVSKPEFNGIGRWRAYKENWCWLPPRPVAMADRSPENPQDLRLLVRIVSACTLGLWAFAGGLLIEVFLFL
jgi:hypothetical protein